MRTLLLSLCVLVGVASPCKADLVTLAFSGRAVHISDSDDVFQDLFGGFNHPIQIYALAGSYTYDDSILPDYQAVAFDGDLEPRRVGYTSGWANNIVSLTFTINDILFSMENISSSSMVLNSYEFDYDRGYFFAVDGTLSAAGRQMPAHTHFLLRGGRVGWEHPMLKPEIPTNIEDYPWTEFNTWSLPCCSAIRVFEGRIDNIEPVPEPATLSLLGVGLLVRGFKRRVRK